MAEMTTWPCMFSLHLPLTRFFQLISVKMIKFWASIKGLRIILHYFHLCILIFFKKLMFAVCRKCDSQSLYCLSITRRPTHLTTTTKSCTMGHYTIKLVCFVNSENFTCTHLLSTPSKIKIPLFNQSNCMFASHIGRRVMLISLTTPFPGSPHFLP